MTIIKFCDLSEIEFENKSYLRMCAEIGLFSDGYTIVDFYFEHRCIVLDPVYDYDFDVYTYKFLDATRYVVVVDFYIIDDIDSLVSPYSDIIDLEDGDN